MRLHRALLGDQGAPIYGALIFGSGVVLTFSMPWASRLSELISQPWHPFPLPFLLTYTFFSAMVALNRGASVVPNDGLRPRVIPLALLRVALGHLLVLPLVTYSRVLFPGGASALVAVVGYVLLIGVLLTHVGILFEVHTARRVRSSSVLRFGFLLVYTGVPLLALTSHAGGIRRIALVSPMEAVRLLLAGSTTAAERMVVFLVPGILSIILLFLAMRLCKRRRDG